MSNLWDLESYESTTDYPSMTNGYHVLEVTRAEVKKTKSGTGEYINVLFKSEETGATAFIMFNVINSNETAVKIGMSNLKSIFTASGVSNLSFKDQYDIADRLIGLKFGAKVSVKEVDGYERVSLSNYKKVDTSENDMNNTATGDVPF